MEKGKEEIKRYKRFDAPDVVADDIDALIDISIQTIRTGRPPLYENSAAGLQEFKNDSIAYLEYVREVNNSGVEHGIIPDIESWGIYCRNLTRQSLWVYEQSRGTEWREFIKSFKNVLLAMKKQLAMRSKIPPIVFMFDAVNNHSYQNTNQVVLKNETTERQDREDKLLAELNDAGLIWNEQTQEFEPKGSE